MLTGKFRASYAHVFEPQAPKGGGDPKYQITMLFPKSDVAIYQALRAEIDKALREGVQNVFNGQMPARPKTPLYDGDGPRENGEPFGEECKGHWVIRASSKTKPSVVDLNVQPIIDPNAFYSGCYARATIHFFAYNQNGNRGVGCGLNNVQKLADGEPLSGRTTAEEDFGGGNAWNSPATYGMTAPNASPGQPYAGYGQPPTGYSQPSAGYGQQQTEYGAQAYGYGQSFTGYGQQSAGYGASQTGYSQPSMGVDPVTGRPFGGGGVMGIC